MLSVLQWVVIAAGMVGTVTTLLSLSRSPHWIFRIWEFPRLQIAALTAASGALYAVFFFRGRPAEWVFLIALVLCVLWQGRKIYPYTPLARVQVERSRRQPRRAEPATDAARPTFRLLIANVLMENRQHERLLEVVRETDSDLLLLVETDEVWARALEPLVATYPYVVRHPQDNHYGMMLFSRLPLHDPAVEFLVQDDIPSIHTAVELPSGDRIHLHCLHPRPPEPIRDQHSTPRDAELVLVGRAIREEGNRPTVVAGDLNDVAWSPTTELFLRLSGLLDPRIGRGFFNTFHADHPFFRYPLDHIFHSNHFRLIELRRCGHVGSDHFPVLVELSYEPDAPVRQPPSEADTEDHEEAAEVVERQVEAAQKGEDRPGQE